MAKSLDAYNAKRDFASTPEPRAKRGATRKRAKAGSSRFVIQKHFARRLHFDLRLEIDGVLKSWAVTRGPSLDPKDKRLAVRTEDHPLAYRNFEGTIPEGAYGAGEVIIWDRGTWQEREGSEGLEAGHLKFQLSGTRLSGGFALVRIKNDKRKNAGKENWLLVKERDGSEQPDLDPVETWIGSVGTDQEDMTLDKRTALTRVRPQLATAVEEPPSGDNWVHELKYDGYRLLACKWKQAVRLWTRNGKDWTARLPEIAQAIAVLPCEHVVLDGELVVLDSSGRSDFAALQKALGSATEQTRYMIFDCLQVNCRDLRKRPWRQRKGELAAVLHNVAEPLHIVEHLTADGKEVFKNAAALGAEGIVSKHIDRPYRPDRNTHFVKLKAERRGTFLVGGFRKSSARMRPFASLLLGEPGVDNALAYCGRVGTGFSQKDFETIGARMKPAKAAPFSGKLSADARKQAVWVEPDLAVVIRYSGRTSDGHLRHPAFERVTTRKQANLKNATRLTNADRLLFPDVGLTKADLLTYLRTVSDQMLPYIAGHPLSLVRSPKGGYDKTFFQKHHRDGMAAAIKRATPDGAMQPAIVIDDIAGLEAAAQFSVLEFHLRGARADAIAAPVRLVMDLDPDETLPFAQVRAAARLLRDVLKAAGLESFPLLTGGKGIHVIAPLNATQTWTNVKNFAERIAIELTRAEPFRFTAKKGASNRKGRIFIDWQRNTRSATAIAPFSPRAREGAPVATPIAWNELSRVSAANAYTIETLPRRLSRLKSDPWQGYEDCDQDVPDLSSLGGRSD